MKEPRKPALPASLLGQMKAPPATPDGPATVTIQVPAGVTVTVVVTAAPSAGAAC